MNVATAQSDTNAPGGLRIALTREALAYAAIVVVAVALRAPTLGAPPLSEREATQAIAALRMLSQGAPDPSLIESPLVFAGTVVSFAILGASNAAARLLPLLAGIGLVLLPLAFRQRFGRLPMLIASGLLAVSPGAVAASRLMDGAGASVLCALLSVWAFWRFVETRQPQTLAASGLWLGLALLADFGTLLVGVGLLFGVSAILLGDDDSQTTRKNAQAALRGIPWHVFVAALAGTVFLVSTLLLTNPRGLGAAADLLVQLTGGIVTRPANAPYLGGLLLLYEAPVLLFGFVGLVRGLGSDFAEVRFLSGWAAGATLLGFTYPGAMPAHVLWMVVPLAALAGLALADLAAAPRSGPAWSLGLHAAIVMALGSVATLWAISFVVRVPQLDEETLSLGLRLTLVGVLWLLLVITSLLWASIWGGEHAWRGLAFGMLGLGLLISLSGSAGLAYVRASDPHELWHVAPGQPALDALAETARDVGDITTGYPFDATLTVEGSPEGLLAWTLRDFTHVTYVEQANPEVATDMVVTVSGDDPMLGERYVGQDFVIVRAWRPAGMSFEQALRWAFFREADTPGSEVRVILWVREDIYKLLPNEVR